MPTRTINVTDEAYNRLKKLKSEGESFSKVINRLTGKFLLLDLIGVIGPEQAQELQGQIREMGERSRKALDRKMSSIVD